MLNGLVEKIMKEGKKVIIFGEDPIFCRSYAQEKGIFFSDDIVGEKIYNKLEKTFFDLLLMSHCCEIITQYSAYSSLASQIGNVQLTISDKIFNEEEITCFFKEFISAKGILNRSYVDDKLKAYTISHFLTYYHSSLDIEQVIELLDLCICLDSEVFYYRLLKCLIMFNNDIDVSKTLLSYIEKYCEGGFETMIKQMRWGSKYSPISMFSQKLSKMALDGNAVAGALLIVNQYALNEPIDEQFYKQVMNCAQRNNAVGIDLLHNWMLKVHLVD